MPLKNKIYSFSPFLIGIALLIAFFGTRGFFGNPKSKIIFSDGIGYYSYLPSNFIYHDQTYSFLEKASSNYYDSAPNPKLFEFRHEVNGRYVNQFFAGTALLMLPFFLLAHLLSIISGLPPDGFSLLYQYFIALGSIFYCWLGCVFLFKLLRRLTKRAGVSALSLTLIVFATNLYHYTLYEPAMSHVYSFMAIAGFLLFSFDYFNTLRPQKLLWAALFLGIILLIRPTNIIVLLLLPFVATSHPVLLSGIKHMFKNATWLFALLIVGLLSFIQLWLWHKQTGQWFIDSYAGQSFDFSQPHIMQVLSSYKKGFFLYTPLCAFSLIGLFWFLKNNRFMLFFALLFLSVAVYTISSWWCWWYGMSFGHRAFIDYYSLFAILLAFGFSLLKSPVTKIITIALCTFFLFLNQVQAYQYRYYILHWELMTEQKYKQVFLKTGKEYRGIFWKDNDTNAPAKDSVNANTQ
ncbi:MAG: hypothetical protein WCM76_09920 [Bacteroidota bacterium]